MAPPAPTDRAPWRGGRIVLGVGGGIAAYKAIPLARELTRLGAEVDPVLTDAATHFVGPVSFQGVTGRTALESLWSGEGGARHIQLAREADAVVVAPATANLMARAAQGRADDLLTAILLATRAPVLMAPAMNDRMWAHPQTQRNAEHLTRELGYELAGPDEGALAVGEGEGPGRMVEPEELVDRVGRILGRRPPWAGRTVLITAGPTREPLDAVRFVGNRSSGRMGYALAREAWLRGAAVTLVTGPTALPPPVGVRIVPVETAAQMLEEVRAVAPEAEVAIFAAAVADFRPAEAAEEKWSRRETGGSVSLELVENRDVAAETRGMMPSGSVAVGFALETAEMEARAAKKMDRKGFDLIVANPANEAGVGFDADANRVVILGRGVEPERLPVLPKEEVASRVLDRVELFLSDGGGQE